jgi:excisionase family DNA binding protein
MRSATKGVHVTEPTLPIPQLVDITTVAKILGVEPRHIRRLVHERRIPFIKWGHLVRFDLGEIGDWLDHNRCPVGGQPPGNRPTGSVRSLPRRRPAQAEPEGSKSDQLRLDS